MIDLYTAATPNGHKASIALEELQLPYNVQALSFDKQEQKAAAFLKINPMVAFRRLLTATTMISRCSSPAPFCCIWPRNRPIAAQRCQRALAGDSVVDVPDGVAARCRSRPMCSSLFSGKAARPHRPLPARETRRQSEVLDTRLSEAQYLADDYSIADIATYPWVRIHDWAGVSVDGLAHLQRWMAELAERPAVQRGFGAAARRRWRKLSPPSRC